MVSMSWANNSLGGMLVAGIAAMATGWRGLVQLPLMGFHSLACRQWECAISAPSHHHQDFDARRSQVAMEEIFLTSACS
jgi:hypothetical protein